MGEQPLHLSCLGLPSPLSNGRVQLQPDLSLSKHSCFKAEAVVLSQADFSWEMWTGFNNKGVLARCCAQWLTFCFHTSLVFTDILIVLWNQGSPPHILFLQSLVLVDLCLVTLTGVIRRVSGSGAVVVGRQGVKSVLWQGIPRYPRSMELCCL